MADSTRTVEFIFNAKDNASKTIKGIESSLTGIGSVAKPLADIGNSVLKLDAALGALAVGGLALAYKKAIDFEDTVVGLNKVLGENENIKTATEEVEKLSEKYGVAQGALLESTTTFKQAGFDLSDSLKLVNSAQELVIAGDVEQAAATNSLTRIMKGYRLEADESRGIVELLNFASNNYATTSGQLAEALAKSAGQSKQAGLSFREASQYLTPIIEVFQNGQMAGTAFGTVLLRLKDDTKRVNAAFEILGFSTEENANRPFAKTSDILKKVAQNWNTVDEVQKDYVANLLFGKEHAGKMIVAMEGMAKAERLVTASSTEMGAALDKEVNTRLASSSIQVAKLVNNFDNLLIAMGEKFKGGTNAVIAGLANIETAIKKGITDGSFDDLFKAFDQFNANLAEKLQATADMLPEVFKNLDFSKIIESFSELGESMGGAFQAVFKDIDLSTTEGMTEAIQIVIDSIETLIDVTTGIIDSWEPFIEAVSGSIRWFNDLDESTKNLVGNFLGISQQAVVVGGIFGGFALSIKGISAAIGGSKAAVVGLTALFGGPVGLTVAVAGASLALVIFNKDFRKIVSEIPGVSYVVQGLIEGFDAIFDYPIAGGKTVEHLTALDDKTIKLRKEALKAKEALKGINEQPVKPDVDAEAMLALTKGMEEYVESRQKLIDQGIIVVKTDADTRTAQEKIDAFWAEIDAKTAAEFKVEANTEPAEKSIKELTEKGELTKFKIEADLDKTKIEEDTKRLAIEAERVQESFKYQAEVKIEQAKAAGEILTKTFETVENSITATGDNIVDLIGQLEGADYQTRQEIQKQVDLREKIEAERLEMEKKLLEAQLKILESQAEFYDKGGEMTLKVEGTGKVQEAAELMWEYIYEFTQAKLVAQGFNLPLLPA